MKQGKKIYLEWIRISPQFLIPQKCITWLSYKLNLNFVLSADSRHKIPRKQAPLWKGLSWSLDLNLFVQVQNSPSPAGRTAQGCANISQVTHFVAICVLLRGFCVMKSGGWKSRWLLQWELQPPALFKAQLCPRWAEIKWNKADHNKLLTWRPPLWYLIMLLLIILFVQGGYFAK